MKTIIKICLCVILSTIVISVVTVIALIMVKNSGTKDQKLDKKKHRVLFGKRILMTKR